MWKQADTEKEELFTLIEQVQSKIEGKGNSKLSGMELRRCNWDQVMVQIQQTSLQWKDSSRRSSRAMRCIDKVGQNSEAFKSWLELLPDGDYGASISGVFALVIGAAGRYTKVEDDIFQALAEIPETLERSRKYIKIYADQRDHVLEKKTFDLFRSILRTLSHVMRFFKDSAIRRFSESILKQASYKTELTKSLVEVKKNSEKIQEEANQCLQRRVLRQEHMLRQADQKTDQGLHLLQSIHQLLLASQILNAKNEAQNEETGFIGRIAPHQIMAAIEGLPSNQRAESKEPAYSNPSDTQSRSNKRGSARFSVSRADKLLIALKYDPSTASEDVDICLKMGEALDESMKAHAAAMVTNARFREFMAEDLASSSLLVNGRVDLSSVEGSSSSSLSYVAAKLVRISETIDSPLGPPYVVKYFCNRHPPFCDGSAVPSPVAMMATLVGQLVTQMIEEDIDVNLSMLTRDAWQKVEKLNLKTLCDIFEELTYQLPLQSVLLCVIDELARYEIAPFMKETETLIRRLTRLVRRHDNIVFKLLVTCQGRALDISKYFTNKTVDLEQEVEADESASWRIASIGD
ncbi:hypothetical protein F4678DRAFT_467631 [Xylaria arbuscula]|nr:hypothetical protein F4678DRAFT_467631 [Xylaria arbuscula]